MSQDRPAADAAPNLENPNPERKHEADPAGHDQPGHQDRPMDDEENLDEQLDETFPASDPVHPKRIDGPNN